MELSDYRKELDSIDAQMLELFKQRMNTVRGVAEYKKENKLPVLQQGREREILAAAAAGAGEELEDYARTFFATLMDVSRSYQERLTAKGGFISETITDALKNTPPMKNYRFHIVRSIKLKVDHSLLVLPGTELKDVKEIFSHEQAIGQCSEFLKAHPGIKVTVCDNTAAAAKMLHESGRHDAASISSAGCANLYGLKKLDTRVQNTDGNFTRFICISKKAMIFPGADRISLMLSLPHRPGSLYSLISKFSVLGLNLTKLESRPIAGSDFEFMFYFDIEASVYSPAVLALLDELSDSPELFVFLGSYSEV